MNSPSSKPALIPRWVLLSLLAVLSIVQGWLTVQWVGKWGFWGAIVVWLSSAKLDPIYATGVLDFLCVMAFVGIWLLHDYRIRAGRVSPRFLAWCFFYLIYPSLGILAYVLWMRPPEADLTERPK